MLQASKLETKEQQIKTQVPFTLTVKTHQWKKKKITTHKAKHTWKAAQNCVEFHFPFPKHKKGELLCEDENEV